MVDRWLRVRFKANAEDPRPIKFPPPGPYWITGHGRAHFTSEDSYAVVVAYIKNEAQLKEFWPDAYAWEAEFVDEIQFTERFPKPEWWNP